MNFGRLPMLQVVDDPAPGKGTPWLELKVQGLHPREHSRRDKRCGVALQACNRFPRLGVPLP